MATIVQEGKKMRANVALLLMMASIANVGANGADTDPSEASRRVQEMIQAAWRSSRPAHARKSLPDFMREWLRPLEAVVVLPRVATTDFGRYQLTEEVVKTILESQLKRSGITVIRPAIISPNPPDPLKIATLCVEILGTVHSDGRAASICIVMNLEQEVALVAAETPTFARADTWQRAAFVAGTPREIRTSCSKALRELTDHFADDWAAAHGDEPARGQAAGQARTRPPSHRRQRANGADPSPMMVR